MQDVPHFIRLAALGIDVPCRDDGSPLQTNIYDGMEVMLTRVWTDLASLRMSMNV